MSDDKDHQKRPPTARELAEFELERIIGGLRRPLPQPPRRDDPKTDKP